jgi:putative flippase GtrA
VPPAVLRRFSSFLGVGALGFIVDAGTFALALEWFAISPYPARLAAFAAAAAFTWALNRRFTFADRRSGNRTAELGRYALASATAGAFNLGVYMTIVWMTGPTWPWPYLALAAGVGAGLAVNFLLYDRIVFRGSRDG